MLTVVVTSNLAVVVNRPGVELGVNGQHQTILTFSDDIPLCTAAPHYAEGSDPQFPLQLKYDPIAGLLTRRHYVRKAAGLNHSCEKATSRCAVVPKLFLNAS